MAINTETKVSAYQNYGEPFCCHCGQKLTWSFLMELARIDGILDLAKELKGVLSE